jgi:hypothetical protein
LDNSDSITRNKETCWQVYLPLKEQATQILDQWLGLIEQDKRLNELKQQAMSLITSQRYPQYLFDPVTGQNTQEREPHWAIADEIDGLRTRIRVAPRELCENTHARLNREFRKVLPDSIIEKLEAQIEARSIRQSCLTIRDDLEQQLRKYAGPPPANLSRTANAPYLLPSDEEIAAVAGKVREMKDALTKAEVEQQRRERELDPRERQRSEIDVTHEEQRADLEIRNTPPHSGSGRRPDPTNQLAIKLIQDGMNEDEAIAEAIRRDERQETKKIPWPDRWSNIKDAIRYHRSKKQPENSNS